MGASLRIRWSANCAARSVTEKQGDGRSCTAEEKGDTEREDSLVPVVLEPKEGDLVEKEKLSSNIAMMLVEDVGTLLAGDRLVCTSKSHSNVYLPASGSTRAAARNECSEVSRARVVAR